ncbi:hypothetical protein JW859_03785 [bacterium]|nr:hypothetical protein [bacterium]
MAKQDKQLVELLGEYRTNVDGKGRVGLGSFRQQFDDQVVMVKMDGYLAIMRPELFSTVSKGIRQKVAVDTPDNVSRLFDPRIQEFKRYFYKNASFVSLDAQGRMTVPAHMREELHLVSDVVWAGCGDMLELWQAKKYDDREAIWRVQNGPAKMLDIFADVPPPVADDNGSADLTPHNQV